MKLFKKLFKKTKKGFTLLELLVVIAIIGVLAGLIFVAIGDSRNRARDSRRASDMRQVISAQEWIINEDNFYVTLPQQENIPAAVSVSGSKRLIQLIDPLNNATYKYVWVGNNDDCGAVRAGRYYCAIAKMEVRGACPAGQTRYVVATNRGTKEICDVADLVAGPPNCAWCLAI